MSLVLEAHGLRKVHGSGAAAVAAVRDVDVRLAHGEFLAVTGPSGCGKSTLLNLLGDPSDGPDVATLPSWWVVVLALPAALACVAVVSAWAAREAAGVSLPVALRAE